MRNQLCTLQERKIELLRAARTVSEQDLQTWREAELNELELRVITGAVKRDIEELKYMLDQAQEGSRREKAD